LSAGEEEELEEQEAQYHHHSARLLKLLKSSSISKPAVSSAPSKSPQVFPVAASGSNSSLSPLQKVRQVGEDMREFHCFLVRVQKDQRIHETLPFKTLKELKYGATTPFTLGIIETLVNEPLPPSC
jgi:hypothetical protein